LGHRQAIIRADRACGLAVAFACTLVLGGCGGVEFQGKIFDYMGVSGDRKQPDVRMSERPPLLLPPNPQALPEPGMGVAAATARPDWPTDPERVKQRVAKEQKAKAAELEAINDPLNPYAGKPTLLDKLFGKQKTDDGSIADVPEPDPSDQRPEEAEESVATARPGPLSPHVPQAPIPGMPEPDDRINPVRPDDPSTMRNLY
jgi:hypothetical protein